MITVEKLKDMLRLQEALERRIGGNDWRAADHSYGLAIHMEAAEIIEAVGWKWWKKHPEVDHAQICLELVDIWHFAMAHSLQYESDINKLGEEMFNNLVHASEQYVIEAHDESLIDLCLGMGFAMLAQNQFPMGNFIGACATIGLDFDELYNLYVSKNVLNIFRQNHGYKEGLYFKSWAGQEDNEHLMVISKELGDMLNSTSLYEALERRYSLVVKH